MGLRSRPVPNASQARVRLGRTHATLGERPVFKHPLSPTGIQSYMLWYRFVAGVICLVAAAGCTPVWRPSLDGVHPAAPELVVDLTAFAPPGDVTQRAYRRSDPARPAVPPQVYERRYRGAARTEGALAATAVSGLADYLGPDAPKAEQRWEIWPDQPANQGAAFFLEFDPPLIYMPASIEAGRAFDQNVRLRYYNRDGVCTRRGTVERRIEFEGLETVEAAGTVYRHCARLKIDTSIRLRWGPWVDITEYTWLAPGVGEVRRIERFSGLAFLARFSGVNTYEALDAPPAPVGATSRPRPSAEVWVRCAVYLDRLLPDPRLGGLAAELAPESATHALTPARPYPT